MDAFESTDVPDPTDFPPDASAPGLRNLDSSLRCTICGELFDAPVTLPCGHCFCSYCIRTAMSLKQECPKCRKSANEGHLRPNPAMEECVTAWRSAREHILRICKGEEQRNNAITQQLSEKMTLNKRKRSSTPDIEAGPSSVVTTPRKHGPKSPSKKKKVQLDFDFEEIHTSDTNEEETNSLNSLNPRLDDFVTCPVCFKKVRYRQLNVHMDNNCSGDLEPDEVNKQSKQQWMQLLGSKNGHQKGKQKVIEEEDGPRLPKASYDTLRDKIIKEMLGEQGLPLQGDRNQLVARHQRWVMMYNSNLDRSGQHRKTRAELRRELKKWEEEASRRKKNTVDDVLNYEKKQKSEFDRLIETARRNKSRKPPTPVQPRLNDEKRSPDETPVKAISFEGNSDGDDIIIVDSQEDHLQLLPSL